MNRGGKRKGAGRKPAPDGTPKIVFGILSNSSRIRIDTPEIRRYCTYMRDAFSDSNTPASETATTETRR